MIVRELKGGSLSKTVVVKVNGQFRVRKFCSYLENREFGLVRWHSQIRRLQYLRKFLGDNVVEVLAMGTEGDFFYYDIPYYSTAVDCSEFLESSSDYQLMLSHLVTLMNKMSKIKFGNVLGSVAVYLREEMLGRIEGALDDLEKGPIEGLANPLGFGDRIKASILEIKIVIREYEQRSIIETLTHGNLTLENMLWDPERSKLILIDPYAETYAETLIGDISQIAQSTFSGYEYILKHNLINDPSVDVYPISEVPDKIKIFGSEFIERMASEPFFDNRLLRIMHASQFIRMFPFKAHSNRLNAFFFLQRGLEIIEGSQNARD